MRKLLLLVVLVALFGVVLYVAGGRMPGPGIVIVSPERFAGTSTTVEIEVDAPAGLSALEVAFEQNDARMLLIGAGDPPPQADAAGVMRIRIPLDREAVPELRSGEGRLVVTASRPVLRGLRTVSNEVRRDLVVRLEPPRLAVLSTFHYVNQGGAEMVLYRVSPTAEEAGLAIESGVDVGGLEYPGFPAAGVDVEGVTLDDVGLHVAFFALLHDQPADTPIRLYARDEAGNAASISFDHRIFPKTFRTSRIVLDDGFLSRVVPPILASTDEVSAEGSLIDQYVVINSELRQKNAETIASLAAETAPEMLWQGEVFYPFTNNAVESGFADRRTYVYEGREVDRQVHLGFDLASVAQAPVLAANRGRVVFAGELGIYGQAVVIDHGMGLQSLYAHLSSIGVQPDAMVERGELIGRTGITGLAGGDHLHFTMLLNGRMVNPVEWWDPHWIQDRVLRKLGRLE